MTVCHAATQELLFQGRGGELAVRPVGDQPLLRHLAELETNDQWTTVWQPGKPTTVRCWFDCWPQPWMGMTVAEELAFGQQWSETAAKAALVRWQLSHLSLNDATLTLSRMDAVRLMLARSDMAGCDLLLLAQPDAGLADDEAQAIAALLQAWLRRSAALAVVTSHRSWC